MQSLGHWPPTLARISKETHEGAENCPHVHAPLAGNTRNHISLGFWVFLCVGFFLWRKHSINSLEMHVVPELPSARLWSIKNPMTTSSKQLWPSTPGHPTCAGQLSHTRLNEMGTDSVEVL